MILWIQFCVDGTGNVIRTQESKTYLTSICNNWSVFREGGTRFVPSETRLHIVDFSETESRKYSMKGKSEESS